MSSATSIDRAKLNDSAVVEPPPRDAFKPWHFFVLLSLLGATAAVVLARQSRPEHLILISLIIGAAGSAAAALYRMLIPLVTRDPLAAVDPLTGSMRAVLEREKMLTLRAIKELEFDRAMGKVSAADFEEMAGRLRTRAISLMKQLDAGASAYREIIEREVQVRIGVAVHSRRIQGEARGARAGTTSGKLPSRIACACGTQNDSDASFCKRCGAKLVGAAPS